MLFVCPNHIALGSFQWFGRLFDAAHLFPRVHRCCARLVDAALSRAVTYSRFLVLQRLRADVGADDFNGECARLMWALLAAVCLESESSVLRVGVHERFAAAVVGYLNEAVGVDVTTECLKLLLCFDIEEVTREVWCILSRQWCPWMRHCFPSRCRLFGSSWSQRIWGKCG